MHRQLEIKDGGSVVIISGTSSKSYLLQYLNTNVIRVAWSAEIKNLAHIMKDKKIQINAVAPGSLLTQHHIEKIKSAAEQNKISYDEEISKKTKDIPAGKYGDLTDVADLISFLLSDKSKHINSTNIAIDGDANPAYN